MTMKGPALPTITTQFYGLETVDLAIQKGPRPSLREARFYSLSQEHAFVQAWREVPLQG